MGRHTLAKTSEGRRTAIRSLLARGMTMAAIAEQMKCSPHTVAAVREMDAEPIADEQRILARKWTNVAQLAVEQVQRRLADGEAASLKELTIVGAVASDKLLTLKGEPTARVLHEKVESVAELKAVLAEALKLAQMKAAAVDVGGDAAPEAVKGGEKEGRAGACEASAAGAATGQRPPAPRQGAGGGSAKLRSPCIQKDSDGEKNSPNEPT